MKNVPIQEKRARGRPREFDRSAALERALEVFWVHGYEGSSISELTRAMGITPPALYGAFTSKAELYREALDLYLAQRTREAWRILEEARTARAAVEFLLRESARAYTDPRYPPGCMYSAAVLTCSEETKPIARLTSALRQETMERIQARLQRGVDEGELPATSDVVGMARFYGAVMQGMSVQAQDGARREDLSRLAEVALAHFPSAR